MKFPFAFIGKPSVSMVQQKRAAWTGKVKVPDPDRYELALIGGVMLCTLLFLVLFLLMLGQLP